MLPRILPFNTLVCSLLSFFFETPSLRYVDLAVVVRFFIVALAVTTITASELAVGQLTSALTMNVLGSVQGIPMVLGGMLLLHESITLRQVAGFTLCLTGAFVYFAARAKRAAMAPGTPLLFPVGKEKAA